MNSFVVVHHHDRYAILVRCIRSKGIPVPTRKRVIKTICNKNVFAQYVSVDGKSKLTLEMFEQREITKDLLYLFCFPSRVCVSTTMFFRGRFASPNTSLDLSLPEANLALFDALLIF